MDHRQAIRQGYTEKYLLGELSEEERFEFEEHFFDCRECAEDLKAAVVFADNAREVLGKESPTVAVPPAAAPFRRVWRRSFRPLRVMAAAAIIAILCGAAYQAFIIVPELRRELALAEAPQAASWEFLSVSRSDVAEVTVPARHRLLGLRLSRSSETPYAEYYCELRDADDRVVQSAIVPSPPAGEEPELVFPLTGLSPGAYAIVLSGLDSTTGQVVVPELARYRFMLRISEE